MAFSQKTKPRTFYLKKIQGLFKHRKKVRGLIIFLLILVLSSLGIFVFGVGEVKAALPAALAALIPGALQLIFEAVKIFLYTNIIFQFLSLLLAVSAKLLAAAFTISTLSVSIEAVQTGWGVTRDLANMFFALILLIIAFATILRIETYGIKQILWRLVVAALLINFSLVIGLTIIDFSNVFTNFFLTGGGISMEEVTEVLASALSLSSVFQTAGEVALKTVTLNFEDVATLIISLFFNAIIVLVAIFTFLAAAILLIIRIIALWFLLIFAPLAWFCMIMPATRNLWSRWWSEFFKWSFFAPIYAFFIYLTLLVYTKGSLNNLTASLKGEVIKGVVAKTFSSPGFVLQYVLVIIMLLGGLFVARSMGTYGAGAMIGIGKGIAGFATKVPLRTVDLWLAKGAGKEGPGWKAKLRRAISFLSPAAWKKAREQRQIQKERESIPVAAGKRQDLMNRLITWGILRPLTLRKIKLGEKTDYAERAKRARYIAEEKEITTTNAEEMVAAAGNAFEADNPYKGVAYLRRLASQVDENEYMRNLAKLAKSPEEAAKYTADAEGLVNLIEEKLKPLMGEQDAYRQGHDIGRILESVGAWSGRPFRAEVDVKGNIKYRIADPTIDDPTGEIVNRVAKKYEISPEQILEELKKPWLEKSKAAKEASGEMARKIAHIEWSKREAQEQMRFTRRFSFIHEGYEAGTGQTIDYGMHEAGKEKMAVYLSTQAARIDSHVKANWMFNHVIELKEINPPLYRALVEDFSKMAKEQIDKLKIVVAKPGPGVVRTDWTPEIAKEELERLGGPVKATREEKPKPTIIPGTEEEFKKARGEYKGK